MPRRRKTRFSMIHIIYVFILFILVAACSFLVLDYLRKNANSPAADAPAISQQENNSVNLETSPQVDPAEETPAQAENRQTWLMLINKPLNSIILAAIPRIMNPFDIFVTITFCPCLFYVDPFKDITINRAGRWNRFYIFSTPAMLQVY